MRVYYPSLDGSPQCAPFLAGSGHFPLVIFLHGQCPSPESFHYKGSGHDCARYPYYRFLFSSSLLNCTRSRID
jgi:hypothetical protein